MKVDNHHPLRPAQTEPRDPARKAEDAASSSPAPAGPASMSHLRQATTDTRQDIDTARVAEIREAIRDGRLEIKPERIADGLIASVQDLLAHRDDGE
ncbi:flagellar biosynthesis anti-sigma factor FlgM [Halomonas nitroreducens]|uniref:Negative regulator of flagellin synthesis n=1 Tax=Halomonas nitroreducens TaxID=447425 RepID=A0A3S0JWP3_9GAMM|nr:flagellar biosynthesis anti-sigma factor FlgM [Halomonas nitroreducens]RTR04380.1 flagellar biosynthesis anti-sigma factor FlgM [Halomonas nitroreducens]